MKKNIAKALSAILTLTLLTACSSGDSGGGSQTNAATAAPAADAAATTAAQGGGESTGAVEEVEIKGIVDLVPHSELIEFVAGKLAAEGVIITIVSTAADPTTNERTQAKEIDFNFFQHYPYLSEWNDINGGNLVNAGDIHVEPISAYSDKYGDVSEVPDAAKIAIPSDATNCYRALRILEIAGFITLDDEAATNLQASSLNVKEYLKPIELIELDSQIIIPTKGDYDVFITNVNKALEAGITSAVLFKEGEDSPYANIIAVRGDLESDKRAAVDKLVLALQSDDTRDFILNKYDGKVIPAKLS
jgi:D-methionine transport system substrate-binding protein